MKTTAKAYSNVALVKYWGKKDDKLRLPMNNSISMTTDAHGATVTVDFSEEYVKDTAVINEQEATGNVLERTIKHIELIRKIAGIKLFARGEARTTLPIGIGLASSASGFAALTAAACSAAGMKLSDRELSIISRQGSGSSCRSIYGGFVEWNSGNSSDTSYSVQLADQNWWDIRDVVALVSTSQRKVDTRNGMKIAKETSPYYPTWLKCVEGDLSSVKKAIKERDFTLLGKTAERNSLMMHATAITAIPELMYWTPETLSIMHEVMLMREEGTECYFTCDTGANLHVLCRPEDENKVKGTIKKMNGVREVIVGKPGRGVEILNKHLF